MPQLYPLQIQDARTLAARRGGLLLYEPGLGKTPTAIKTVQLATNTGPWAVVAPRNALDNWKEEIGLWAPSYASSCTLANYEALAQPQVLQAVARAKVIIFDEIHEARDVNTLTFRRCYQVSRAPGAGLTKKVYGLTATPIFNGVADLLAQLVLVGIYELQQYPALLWRYTNPRPGGLHTVLNYQDAARIPELRAVLQATTIRRSYPEMGIRLPPLIPQKIPVFLDLAGAGADYAAARADFAGWYAANRGGRQLPPLARFTTLRRLQSMAKVQQVAARAKVELAQGCNVLLFTEFRETAEALAAQLPSARVVIGGQARGARTAQLAGMAAQGQALVATLDALDSALNLQTFSRVFFVDLPWTPAQLDQTFKRAWRQHQQRAVGVAYFYVPNDEAENHVSSVLLRKADLLAQLGLEPLANFRQIGLS
jgi:SWI/SNF-related matrix-associated actin-dependent regulator 1 of chromatin subfamily A